MFYRHHLNILNIASVFTGLWWGYVLGIGIQDLALLGFVFKLNWNEEAHKVTYYTQYIQ